jgi:glycosyltransferase involved in cell wall biosynthesis
MKRLAIVTTHPIQYNAPLFKKLHDRGNIEIKVYYTLSQSQKSIKDKKFKRQICWDIPLVEGYHFSFFKNISLFPDSNGFFGVVNVGLLRELIEKEYDAVLIYGWHHWSHFLLMQLLPSKQKIFFRGDSVLLNKFNPFKDFLKKIFLRIIYRNVYKGLYVGSHNKQYMLEFGFKNENLIYAPHVVDNDRFNSNKEKMQEKAFTERMALGFGPNDIVFIYVGKFYSLKRLDLLINTFKTLNDVNIKLLLVGNGEDEHKLKHQAIDDSRISFMPFKNQSEMPWVYRMGDVFVLPSESETWGLSVNEAMACGLPVIVSSACGCAPELVIHGETGYLFSSNDLNDLRNVILKMSNKSLVAEMSRLVEAHIKNFNLDILADVIERSLLLNV